MPWLPSRQSKAKKIVALLQMKHTIHNCSTTQLFRGAVLTIRRTPGALFLLTLCAPLSKPTDGRRCVQPITAGAEPAKGKPQGQKTRSTGPAGIAVSEGTGCLSRLHHGKNVRNSRAAIRPGCDDTYAQRGHSSFTCPNGWWQAIITGVLPSTAPLAGVVHCGG